MVIDRHDYPDARYIQLFSGLYLYRLDFLLSLSSFYGGKTESCSSDILEYALWLVRSSVMSVAGKLLDDAGRARVL